MERSGKREGLLEKTAEVFDLPGDVVAVYFFFYNGATSF